MDYYQAQEASAAQLRAEKNSAKNNAPGDAVYNNQGSIRQRLLRKRNLRKAAQEAAREKAKSAVASPVKQGTGALLKFSWLNLVDSLGLTLIYINLHVFLRFIFPSMFCKLGEEWLPKQAAVAIGGASQAAEVSKNIGLIEVIGLLLLDLLVIIILILAIGSIFMILDGVYGIFGWVLDWFNQIEPTIVA